MKIEKIIYKIEKIFPTKKNLVVAIKSSKIIDIKLLNQDNEFYKFF